MVIAVGPAMLRSAVFVLSILLTSMAYGATYSLPAGPLPNGCVASGATVNCAFYLTLGSSDVITVTSPVTLVLNGAGGFNGAQINVGGSAASLTISVNGSLNVGNNNTRIVANISAANIYGASSTNTQYTGVLTVGGQLGLGNGNEVNGAISASSVAATNSSGVIINGNVTTSGQLGIGSNSVVTGQMNVGSLASGQNNTFTGDIQSTGTVTIGQSSVVNGNISANLLNVNSNATVNGSITSTGNINLSQGSTVNGPVNASANLNASQSGITVNGNITTVNDANLGPGMQIDGNVVAGGSVSLQTNAYVDGNLTGNAVYIQQDAMIEGNVEAGSIVTNAGIIQGSVNSNGPVYLSGGSCVTNNQGRIVSGQGCVNGYVNAPNENDIPQDNVNGPVCDQNTNIGPCAGSGPVVLFYRIEHAGTTLTCDALTVQVRACGDPGCNTQPQLTGAVSVVASGPQVYTGNGSFANNSLTTFSVSIPTTGNYSLSLGSVPELAADPFQCSGPDGCAVVASSAQLTFRQVSQATILDQVAGVPFDIEVAASACSGALTGSLMLNMAIECVDPDACYDDGTRLEVDGVALSEIPALTGLPATFDAGSTTLSNLVYEDAGRIRIHASVNAGPTQLTGQSNAFVVRPDAIGLDVLNPFSGQIVGRAGDDLQFRLRALSRSGQVTPNFGREADPDALELAEIGNSVVPADGADGLVQTVDDFVKTADGEFSSQRVRYSEVGTAELTARIASMDYLGTGPLFTRHTVGRFVPWMFVPEMGVMLPGCVNVAPGFTYLDQPFSVGVSASARNRDGVVTQNYPDIGSGNAVTLFARDTEVTSVLSSRLFPRTVDLVWSAGLGAGSSASIVIESRLDPDTGHTIDGPFESVQLGWQVNGDVDWPEVAMQAADFNDDDADCESASSCEAVSLADSLRFIYGRLLLTDTFGVETEDVPVTLIAQFWNGERFITHVQDQCTDVNPDLLEIIENISTLATEPAGYNTLMLGGRAPAGSLRWKSPNVPGRIQFRYLAPSWLKSGDNGDEDPQASAEFGTYGGHDLVRSWQLIH